MDPRDLDRSLPFLLHDVTRLLRRNFHRRVQALGLTQAQYRAFAHLARNEGTNQSALADVLEIQPITLARILDRLGEMGLVERRPDENDRRAFRLYLTPEAGPVLDEMRTHGAGAIEEALAGFSPGARERLIDDLASIKENLAHAEPKA
jgi:MarR family transcriptional regulator, transcriptional regulator for hemolysin